MEGENVLSRSPLLSMHEHGSGHYTDCSKGAGLIGGPGGEERVGWAIWGVTIGLGTVEAR